MRVTGQGRLDVGRDGFINPSVQFMILGFWMGALILGVVVFQAVRSRGDVGILAAAWAGLLARWPLTVIGLLALFFPVLADLLNSIGKRR